MKQKMQLQDIFDLGFVIDQDEGVSEDDLIQRDRKIYLNHILPKLTDTLAQPQQKSFILKEWLTHMRNAKKLTNKDEEIWPGNFYQEFISIAQLVCFSISILIGMGTTFALLQYNGASPLNISLYLWLFVFVQIFLLTFIIIIGLMPVRFFKPKINHMWFLILDRFVLVMMNLWHKLSVNTKTAQHRTRFQAKMGSLKLKKTLYGRCYFWLLFTFVQIFGVGLNLAIIFSTFFKVMVYDLAFGWQSTIDIGATGVFQIVKVLSIPWSWLIPVPIAHPSFEQVAGSRIILKDGIQQLMTSNLVSWWPFLCFAVLFYGLIPRMMMFIIAKINFNKSIQALFADHPHAHLVIARMQTPILKTDSIVDKVSKHTPPTISSVEPSSKFQTIPKIGQINTLPPIKKNKDALFRMQHAILLTEDEAFAGINHAMLVEKIQRQLNIEIVDALQVVYDFEDDQDKLKMSPAFNDIRQTGQILILQEAWQPPIRQHRMFLQELRQFLGPKTAIAIILVGMPDKDDNFAQIVQKDFLIWQNFIQTIGDPFLRVQVMRVENGN